MRKTLLLAFTIVIFSITANSQSYDNWVRQLATPPFKTPKIIALIKSLNKADEESQAVSEAVFNKMNFEEKFNYTLWHPEEYQQNCDPYGIVKNMENKLFGYPADCFGEMYYSERQLKFLNDNKAKIIDIIKKNALKTGRIHCNYKMALLAMETKDQIPFIIDTYKKATKKDYDLLGLLNAFMSFAEYEPYVNSVMYKKMYSGLEKNYVTNNKANRDLIIQRATDFYNSLQKK